MLFLNSDPSIDSSFSFIAGPCSVESYEIFRKVAFRVKKAGACALRGGIYKMRTHAHAFQGLGSEAIAIVQAVKKEVELPFISEITDPRQLESLDEVVDVFQVGARNMHNYELLKELGKTRKPILLKRGLSAYLDEFLAASEYILRAGNSKIILCERGIRTFERSTRNTLDLSAIPYLKQHTALPVWVDPSHATGRRDLVIPMCWAAAAAGADGIIVEIHPEPSKALSDGDQALTLEDLDVMIPRLNRILEAMDRKPLNTETTSVPSEPAQRERT